MPIRIGLSEFMTALAMCLRSFHRCVCQRSICYRFLVPAIERLFLASGPAAVPWFVVAVVVNAVKRQLMPSWPHILTEVFESLPAWCRSAPSFANGNPATAPIPVFGSVWIRTSLNHICPSVVDRLLGLVAHRSFLCAKCNSFTMGNANAA